MTLKAYCIILLAKGEQGNKDLEFFKQAVIDPFSRAYTELDPVKTNNNKRLG
jgi:hypothetical protein